MTGLLFSKSFLKIFSPNLFSKQISRLFHLSLSGEGAIFIMRYPSCSCVLVLVILSIAWDRAICMAYILIPSFGWVLGSWFIDLAYIIMH